MTLKNTPRWFARMQLGDARKLDQTTQEALRHRAVLLVDKGATHMEAALAVGMHRGAVNRWYGTYRRDGASGFEKGKRGRRAGSGILSQLPSCATMKQTANGAQSPDVFIQVPGDYLNAGWAIDKFWPEAPKPLIPEYLPFDVARIYLQAERNFPILGNEEAAGIMYGKSLDIGLKKIDPSLTGMLGRKIQKLSKEGKLTADIAEWSGHVRDIPQWRHTRGRPYFKG